jgi:DNA-binding transcriptional MocR family regulator
MKLSPFRIERFYARYEHSTRFMLSSSDCESRTIAELLELEPDAHERLLECWCGYTEPPGAPALRQAIASLYERTGAEEVVVTSCAEEGIFLLYHALLRPSDHAIVETPCYESALQLARSTGADVSEWRRRYEDGWAHDFDALAGLIRPATRLIYLNQPHNPTGTLMARPVFEQVIGLARAHGLVVLSTIPPTGCRPRAMSTSAPSRSAASPRATACRGCGSAGSPPATAPCVTPSAR